MSKRLHISSSRVATRLWVLGQVPRDQSSTAWTRTQEVIQSPSGMQRIGASDYSSQQGLPIGRAYSRDNGRAFQVGQGVGFMSLLRYSSKDLRLSTLKCDAALPSKEILAWITPSTSSALPCSLSLASQIKGPIVNLWFWSLLR